MKIAMRIIHLTWYRWSKFGPRAHGLQAYIGHQASISAVDPQGSKGNKCLLMENILHCGYPPGTGIQLSLPAMQRIFTRARARVRLGDSSIIVPWLSV